MKKYKFLLILAMFGVMLACDDEGSPKGTGKDFETIASAADEDAGTVVLPLRGGKISASSISFGGTAREGEDFTLGDITSEGIEINIIDDDSLEDLETIRVLINTTGNNIHTISVPCDGGDPLTTSGAITVDDFAGDWSALEDYGGGSTYGPYDVTLVQDGVNPNRFDFDNFYDSGYDAYLVFDFANGTVSFPDQAAGGDATNPNITLSSGTFDLCGNTLTINLHYDGADWTYRWTR